MDKKPLIPSKPPLTNKHTGKAIKKKAKQTMNYSMEAVQKLKERNG